MRNLLYALLILPILSALGISAAAAQVIAPDLKAVLESSAADTEIPVIITLSDRVNLGRFKTQPKRLRRSAIIKTLRRQADTNLRPLKAFLGRHGARRVRELWLIQGMSATLKASALRQLENMPGIAEVRLDEIITIPEILPAVGAAPEWNIEAVNAPALWALGVTGSGIVVANLDSGVDIQHADLSGRFRGGANSWYDPNGQHPLVPHDADGHGTATMGIMVGGDATGSAIGVAPGAQWIAVKIFNDAGEATTSNIHLGFQWLLDPDGDPDTDDSPHVVNNSWGADNLVNICNLEFQDDILTLKGAGIAVVFAAGNQGPAPATSISPANNQGAVAVGAVNSQGIVAGNSSRGPGACNPDGEVYPQVVAPGVDVKVADISLGGLFPNAYTSASGTSFSAPHLAGAMALLLDAFPDLGLAELEAVLKTSARDMGPTGPDHTYGYGSVDALAAYRTLAGCTDGDGDGYYGEAICGGPSDCDDNNAGIFPEAPEIKGDGIDQDCNGFDLSIEITTAVYRSDTDALNVIAVSALGEAAALQLSGFGPLLWNSGSAHWEISVAAAGGNPGTVKVSGIEGSETAATTICFSTCPADISGDGNVNFTDLALMRASLGMDCRTLPPEQPCIADITGDGWVNFADLAALRSALGRTDCLVCN